ncbi:tRNA lysidine(34) synthetase TilS [Palleronia rufa]|uniref:tRNA lysidine(34) synthetase TilS n=1 Tax=Palleronia rufa TaxID=1530186 RepID=UPI00068AA417|nr:tRNA lysidine(34) synthetase TilS [Palleronia rufa]
MTAGGPRPAPVDPGPAHRIGVAVSGGGDSMACLDLVLSGAGGRSVHAVTVDHGLRAEARAEAVAVAAFCAARGISHDTLQWHWDGTGNLQARARDARYRLIGEWARVRALDVVMLGHTADDVAESLLLRLRRAPGCDGLAEMPRRFARHGVAWARPLLDLSRAALRDHLRGRAIGWSDDPSNDDPRYDRARARRVLAALAPMGAGVEALSATARHLRQASTALDHYADEEAARRATADRGDLLLDLTPPLPAEIARRLVAAALRWVSGRGDGPRQAGLDALATWPTPCGIRTLHGCLLSPGPGQRLRIAREPAAVARITAPADRLWDGRWRLTGPAAPDLCIAALGRHLTECATWRDTGLPRHSLMASPAVFRHGTLVAAPVAGHPAGWQAVADGRGNFAVSGQGD